MKIRLVDGTEYEVEQFMVSNVIGEEENESTIVTFNLTNKIKSSEFFETVEQAFTEENSSEVVLYNGVLEIKFYPKSAINKIYTSNTFSNQTTISFKN
mgnify:FL=1